MSEETAQQRIERKMIAFENLGNRAKKKEFLTQINAEISSFKNQVRLTGSVAKLNDNYRAYLKRVEGTAQPDSKTSKAIVQEKKISGPRKASCGSAKENVEDNTTRLTGVNSALAATMMSKIAPKNLARISDITRKCLKLLESPLADSCLKKDDGDDLSSDLEPLLNFTAEFIRARLDVDKQLTHNHAENYERLRMKISKSFTTVAAPAIFGSFFGIFGVEVEKSSETTSIGGASSIAATEQTYLSTIDSHHIEGLNESSMKHDEAISREVHIVQNATHHALTRWAEKFPPPAAENIGYPIDFTDKEKAKLRPYARKYLDENQHLVADTASKSALNNATQQLLQNWPIKKGNFVSIAQLVLNEARSNWHLKMDARSRSRTGSMTTETRSISVETTVEGAADDVEADVDEAEFAAARERGKARSEVMRRKRRIDADSDDEDLELALRVSKASRIGNHTGFGQGGTAARGRSLIPQPSPPATGYSSRTTTRYPSPTKIAAGEASLASIYEVDSDE